MKLYEQIKPYQYYILGGIIILLLYFLSRRSIVEGFDGLDSEKHAPEVKNSHTKIMDSLNVSKYRANYEDIIKDKLIILGKGHFDIDIDESNTKHSISKNTLTKIFVEIEK